MMVEDVPRRRSFDWYNTRHHHSGLAFLARVVLLSCCREERDIENRSGSYRRGSGGLLRTRARLRSERGDGSERARDEGVSGSVDGYSGEASGEIVGGDLAPALDARRAARHVEARHEGCSGKSARDRCAEVCKAIERQ